MKAAVSVGELYAPFSLLELEISFPDIQDTRTIDYTAEATPSL
jgi:hypothetical protein